MADDGGDGRVGSLEFRAPTGQNFANINVWTDLLQYVSVLVDDTGSVTSAWWQAASDMGARLDDLDRITKEYSSILADLKGALEGEAGTALQDRGAVILQHMQAVTDVARNYQDPIDDTGHDIVVYKRSFDEAVEVFHKLTEMEEDRFEQAVRDAYKGSDASAQTIQDHVDKARDLAYQMVEQNYMIPHQRSLLMTLADKYADKDGSLAPLKVVIDGLTTTGATAPGSDGSGGSNGSSDGRGDGAGEGDGAGGGDGGLGDTGGAGDPAGDASQKADEAIGDLKDSAPGSGGDPGAGGSPAMSAQDAGKAADDAIGDMMGAGAGGGMPSGSGGGSPSGSGGGSPSGSGGGSPSGAGSGSGGDDALKDAQDAADGAIGDLLGSGAGTGSGQKSPAAQAERDKALQAAKGAADKAIDDLLGDGGRPATSSSDPDRVDALGDARKAADDAIQDLIDKNKAAGGDPAMQAVRDQALHDAKAAADRAIDGLVRDAGGADGQVRGDALDNAQHAVDGALDKLADTDGGTGDSGHAHDVRQDAISDAKEAADQTIDDLRGQAPDAGLDTPAEVHGDALGDAKRDLAGELDKMINSTLNDSTLTDADKLARVDALTDARNAAVQAVNDVIQRDAATSPSSSPLADFLSGGAGGGGGSGGGVGATGVGVPQTPPVQLGVAAGGSPASSGAPMSLDAASTANQGMPMAPPMGGMGGMGGQNRERDRSTWLDADEGSWEDDDEAVSWRAVGRNPS